MMWPSRRKILTSSHLFALLLVLGGSGCAGTPARDGSWLEIRSPNFSIYTALAERDGRELLENLELFRATILAVTKVRSAHPHVPTDVYAFRSESDFRPFAPRQNAVGFFRPTLRANFAALSAGARAAEARATLCHEYAHFLLQSEGSAHHPLWFEEGFAELLSSIDVTGKTVRIGDPPRHRVDSLRSGSSMPYSRVIGAQSYEGFTEDELQMFYAQSWLLVHYLTLRKDADFPTQMQQFIERIERRVDPDQAFGESFGIEVQDLPALLQTYTRKLPVFGIPHERLAPDIEAAVRTVPPDEVDTRLGWLALNGGGVELARQHFERAIAANPNRARAIAGMGDVNKLGQRWAEAEAAYHRALEIAPDDWQNHLELGEYWVARALVNFDKREEHVAMARESLARAIELAPEIPEGHAVLGSTYLIPYPSGEQPSEPGIEALERAAKLLPSNAEIDYPLARLYLRAGDRKRATELLRRIANQPHRDPHPQAWEILEHIEQTAAPGS